MRAGRRAGFAGASGDVLVIYDDVEQALAWEASQAAFAFHRTDERHTRLKRHGDCGHWIDGSEPYRYQVWLLNGEDRLGQRIDCEFCARDDSRF